MKTFTPEQVPAEIARAREALDFRPTAVVLAAHICEHMAEPTFLLGNSAKDDSGAFWPVQGGIDDGETPYIAAVRELDEEANVQACPDRVTILGAARYETRQRGSYTAGKLIIATTVPFCDQGKKRGIRADEEEMTNLQLFTRRQTRRELRHNILRKPKAAAKARFLRRMMNEIDDSMLSLPHVSIANKKK